MIHRLTRVLLTVVMLLTVLAACRSQAVPADSPAESGTEAPAAVHLETVTPAGMFNGPVGLEKRPGEPDILYMVEQQGRIRQLDLTQPATEPALVLDITDRVYSDGNEQGLLGLAFDPSRPDKVYVNYTTATHTVVSRFLADRDDSGRWDPASEDVILTFPQPYSNHNGGQLVFGPDGLLYIGTGDGGGAGDPQGNAQNRESLLGKLLRIDVSGTAGGKSYAIPRDNPFSHGGGAPEVYAYGFRNPWRFSFDAATRQLWAADVGQDRTEEIDLVVKGGNYGWNILEGTSCYKPAKGCDTAGFIPPVYEYSHEAGVSVTGGFVYRGSRIRALRGWYIYADYAFGTIWSVRQGKDGKADNRILSKSALNITSFGTDANNELYMCAQDGGIYRLVEGQDP
jgi:glucose/arabinose dehydrogenase